MNQRTPIPRHLWFVIAITASLAASASNSAVATPNGENKAAPIPMDQLGAVAGKQYQGDGLFVSATPDGARLRCAFQRLEGQVTWEGLWLSSTADGSSSERFRIVAVEVGRVTPCAPFQDWLSPSAQGLTRPTSMLPTLPCSGIVDVAENVARFIRPGLTEEYTVSVDGIRQDFLIEQPPAGEGELRVELEVTGARAEPLANGARLVLDGSGRKLAYNRLRVVDATGRELPARMEVSAVGDDVRSRPAPLVGNEITSRVASQALLTSCPTMITRLAVLVDDAAAIYPVRIDPTFSDADWVSMGGFPGANDYVNAAVTDASGNLYIGGKFTIAGDVFANFVAKWDGSSWSSLGAGMNDEVFALASDGSNVYAGGFFTMAGGSSANRYIAKWDGSSWTPLGSGVDYVVYAIAVAGSNVYAGGDFATAGGSAARGIAKWDGSNWSALGAGVNNQVRALTVSGSDLYAGGLFTRATNSGGIAVMANYVAKWSGSNWTALGSGMNAQVYALASSGSNVYVGGFFTQATDSNGAMVTANYIARWNGSNWAGLSSGMNNYTLALAVSGSDVFAGGYFTTAGGFAAFSIAKWDGNNWSGLGSGMNNPVNALSVSGSSVYAGGTFTTAFGVKANYIVERSGSNWTPLGSGMNERVTAMAESGNDIYAGGLFTTVKGGAANYIAKWNGINWSSLGSGMNSLGYVYALAASDTNLYVGGAFTTAGGTSANRIAKWNGVAWSRLGSGMNNTVNALAVSGSNVFAGGNFTTAGGITANRIAQWNGNNWSPLGSGMNGTVIALVASGTNLFAGGSFTTAGGVTVNRIAKWDGNTWVSLGSGMNNTVSALAMSGCDLYAGGDFTTAGGINAYRIAKWNGNNWTPLGGGLDYIVSALALSGSDVYAGGRSATSPGYEAFLIGKWDGADWSALGSGVNSYVESLALSGTNLYVGGRFTTAGSKVSAYIAKANISAARGKFSGIAYSQITGFSCTFVDATVGQPYRIQTSPSLTAAAWTDFTNFTYPGPIVITDASAFSGTNKFFRAITP